LQIADYLSYTPEQPSFFSPKIQGVPDATISQQYLIGIQTFRANSLINTGRVEGSYEVSPTLALNSSYMYSFNRFGNVFVEPVPGEPAAGAFFNATTTTVDGGTSLRLSSRDTVGLTYIHSNTEFDGAPGFVTQTAMAEYSRHLTPSLTATVNGGVTLLEPDGTKHFVGYASLDWRLLKNEKWSISYTRTVAPSIFIVSTALLSQTINGGVLHQLTPRLTLTASANYAMNESTSPTADFNFRSYATVLDFTYMLTPNMSATLGGEYYNFDYGDLRFDRKAIIFSISAIWP
jgi:hypothetical protein